MDKEICNKEWMKYWDKVNVELYALIKQVKKKDKDYHLLPGDTERVNNIKKE
jgi:hypothetical protein